MSDVYVVYDAKTLAVISISGGTSITNISPEEFLKNRHKIISPNHSLEELGIMRCPEELNNKIQFSAGKLNMVINPLKNEVTYNLFKEERRNTTYNDREIKRDFSIDEIKKMYYDDYINFNLKNFIKSNNLKCGFIPLKDIKIRSHMFNINWNYFHSDPYLRDSNFDKLKLGRDIVENGTYWPMVVAPISKDKPNERYVFEGNHRAISLKLLQMEGEVPEDYQVFCIEYEQNYEMLQIEGMYKEFEHPFKYHALIELVYGDDVIVNEEFYNLACNQTKEEGGDLIGDYTIEKTGYVYDDGFICLQSYAHFLRDLIYNNREVIKPSIYLNNPSAFEGWINEL